MIYTLIFVGIVLYGAIVLFVKSVNDKRKLIKNLNSPNDEFPGTSYSFPLGDIMPFIDYNRYIKEYGSRFRKWGAFLFWIANQPVIFLLKPEYIKEVLTKPEEFYERNFTQDFLTSVFGVGLLGVSGNNWKRQHRIMQKAFSTTNIITFFPLFKEVAQKRFEEVGKAADEGKPIDINRVMNEIAGEIIIRSAFGCSGTQAAIMAEAFQDMLRAQSPLLRIPFSLYLPIPKLRKYWEAFTLVKKIGEEIVVERTQILKKKRDSNPEAEIETNPQGVSVLVDLLLDAKDDETGTYLSEEELKDNARTFLAAGSETTATAMSWFLYNMSQNPEVWDKVVQEVDQVVPEDVESFSYQHLAKFSYMPLAINESLRVTPSVSLITPRVSVDESQVGDWVFPKGTNFSFSIPMVHFCEDNYENPDKFYPERWENGEDRKRPYSFVAFGAGRRTCIGKYFGLLEMKTVLALFLKQFSFHRVPKPDGTPNNDVIDKLYFPPVLSLKGGLPIYVKRRELKPNTTTSTPVQPSSEPTPSGEVNEQ